jgi:DNA-binding NarL/FixJ family response regulator
VLRKVVHVVPLRVVIADDAALLRAGIVALLDSRPDIDVVAQCESLPELLRVVDESSPDVVLTDIRMPPGLGDEGIQAAQRLRSTHPEVGVVLLSHFVDGDFAHSLIGDGSRGRGYLLKERVADPEHLVDVLWAVSRGESVIDPLVVEAMISGQATQLRSPLRGLSPRELEVLERVAAGASNAGIASALFVSDRAVEKHISSIFSKLGLPPDAHTHRRVAAVVVFLATGPPERRATGANPLGNPSHT